MFENSSSWSTSNTASPVQDLQAARVMLESKPMAPFTVLSVQGYLAAQQFHRKAQDAGMHWFDYLLTVMPTITDNEDDMALIAILEATA